MGLCMIQTTRGYIIIADEWIDNQHSFFFYIMYRFFLGARGHACPHRPRPSVLPPSAAGAAMLLGPHEPCEKLKGTATVFVGGANGMWATSRLSRVIRLCAVACSY